MGWDGWILHDLPTIRTNDFELCHVLRYWLRVITSVRAINPPATEGYAQGMRPLRRSGKCVSTLRKCTHYLLESMRVIRKFRQTIWDSSFLFFTFEQFHPLHRSLRVIRFGKRELSDSRVKKGCTFLGFGTASPLPVRESYLHANTCGC